LKAINIISFDVPYPANYGGVIDVFHKIKHFHSKGIKVHLHCFEYGRGEQKELRKYCASVNYYKRKTGINAQISSTPYIVKSRSSEKLKNNLLKNDFPILFEGLHCCFLLNNSSFKKRIKIVRNHNIEHDYYNELAKVETNPIKRKYYKTEAKKLEQFEPILKHADLCLPISNTDFNYFKKSYPNNTFIHAPCFHPNENIKVKSGKGNYVLYHGNLGVSENINAVKFIINNLFQHLDIPLKIAGLNPSKVIINLVKTHKHIELIKNPGDDEMSELIANAQINLLYTEQATGLKLKLLNALYNGRHCIVNSKMVEGTSLTDTCLVEDKPEKLTELIKSNFNKEISNSEIEKRRTVLSTYFSNENSLNKIINSL